MFAYVLSQSLNQMLLFDIRPQVYWFRLYCMIPSRCPALHVAALCFEFLAGRFLLRQPLLRTVSNLNQTCANC